PALAQALARRGEELVEDQAYRRSWAAVGPGELRVEPFAGGGEEVSFGSVEAHDVRDVAVLTHQRGDEAVEEGGVGDLVAHGGAGRQGAVLDAQVGLALGDAVAGAVPAPDAAVVQAQRRELGHAAGGQDL